MNTTLQDLMREATRLTQSGQLQDATAVGTLEMVEVDVGPVALTVRQANPDYTIFHGYAYTTWPEVVKLAKDYGMKSKFLVTVWSSDIPALEKIGPSIDGLIMTTPQVGAYDDIFRTAAANGIPVAPPNAADGGLVTLSMLFFVSSMVLSVVGCQSSGIHSPVSSLQSLVYRFLASLIRPSSSWRYK